MAETVTIFEVGPRDGLQNEPRLIPAADKIRLVDLLSACGLAKIEAASFVSPKWVPQMADAAEVMAGIARKPGVVYAALTPNLQGYRRAKAAHADEVAIFASASEGFSRHNVNCSIEESLARFAPVMDAAKADGVRVRGYVSCITECPYDGATPVSSVVRVTKALLDLGCYEVSLGDTIGRAQPQQIHDLLGHILTVATPAQLAGHFHDTGGKALDNIAVCLAHGLRTFDASIAGLGGCPYAPGAQGNVDTQAVASFMKARDFKTNLNMEALEHAAHFAKALKKVLTS